MSDNASANITQILTSVQNFVTTYENPLWAKTATVDDIKTTFKLGNFIEKTIATFKSKNYVEQFLNLLNVWSKEKNLKTYSQDFFELANDQILEKLFKFPNIKETTLDIGVRVYTSMYPKERFTNFLQKLILTSSSLTAIADFVNSSISAKTVIENGIILQSWSDYLTRGQQSIIKSEIETDLSLYKVEAKLPRIISLLSSKGLSQPERDVQILILDCLLEKMMDRSLLSKTFWLALFQKVKLDDLAKVSSAFQEFLESLLNFVEYIGTMMHKDYKSELSDWRSDPNISFCPEITYIDILNMLRTVCRDNGVKEYVLERLDRAEEHLNPTLWKELKIQINENSI